MEPQEGDIAEDGAGNFLVRRGNDWYPSQQDGRPLQRIPRPDYGANHFQLPNGDIVRQGPRGGQETVENFGGAGGGAGGSGLVSADQRGRYNIGADPLVRAERNLAVEEAGGNPLNRDWGAVALNAIDLDPRGDSSFRPFAPLANLLGGQDYQNAQQALSTYEASLMPIQSGASVTASEAARQIRADFPALGDSAETLRRKAANRRDRINAILAGIGRPPAFTEQDLANPADPSTDREVAALSTIGGGEPFANADANDVSRPSLRTPENYYPDSAAAIAGPGPTYTGPGSSAANPFVLKNVDLDSEDDYAQRRAVANLSRGMYVQQPDGTVSRLTGDPYTDENAANNQGLGGVMTRGRNLGDQSRAFAMAAAEQVPFLDEAAVAAAGAISGRGYSDVRDSYQALQQIDNQTNRGQRIAGGLAGAAGTMALPVGMLGRGANVAQAARGAGVVNRLASFGARNAPRVAGGAVTGGIYGAGAGEGGLTERGGNALEGAAMGGVLGPIAEPLARPVIGAVRGVGDAGRRLFRPNALEDAAGTYASRFRPDTNALAARADELEALGIEPRFINLVSDARHGTFRALNTRGTDDLGTARDVASRLPETMRRNLPSRVRRIAEEEISTESRPALEMMEELSAARRANAQSGSQDFNSETVRLDDNIASALRSPVARSSLTQAAAVMEGSLDPAERQAAEYIRRVATDDAGRGAMMTVREVQDVTQALNTAARSAFNSENPTAGPTLSALARSIRDQGRQQSEGYRQWLTQYADDSQLLEAVTTGRNFVTADPNPINARSTDAFVRQAEQATPPELMMQRAAARGAMEAQGSGPSGARVVLENLTSNLDQQRRALALGLDAPRLAARSEAELRVLQDAQRVSPRSGSETGTNVADQAAEVAGVAGDVIAGRPISAVTRIGRRLMSLGFNDQQAEAIGLAALDPTRTREIIDLLATRMNRQDARSTLRAIRFAAAQQSGQIAGDEE